jgi:pre-mRNA-processing factor 40
VCASETKPDVEQISSEKDASTKTETLTAPETITEQETATNAQTKMERDREIAREALKELLREKNISSTASWEYASRQIGADARFHLLKRSNERKQVFNEYKAQKAKEERELHRQRAQEAREAFKHLLENHDKVYPDMRWKHCCELFGDHSAFKAVHSSERREIFDEVVYQMGRKEKAEEQERRERHQKTMKEIYANMQGVTYKTTWAQCLEMLETNADFTDDDSLQGLDKEDALVAFEDHIRELERKRDDQQHAERVKARRQERYNREGFVEFLGGLHKAGKLTSTSLWVDLYDTISANTFYDGMLGQPGSSPLDLFKLYVTDLKDRLHDEKKLIKEIIKDNGLQVEVDTPFEKFEATVLLDDRSEPLDRGNIKLTFKSLHDKAEAREKERLKAEERKHRKREAAFKEMLRDSDPPVTRGSSWELVRLRFENDDAFKDVPEEAERLFMFKDFIKTLEEEEAKEKEEDKKSHRSHKKKRKKRSRSRSPSRSRSRSRSGSESASEAERKEKRKRSRKRERPSPSSSPPPRQSKDRSPSSDSTAEKESRKKKHKKKSKKRRRHSSPSVSPESSKKRSKKSKAESESAANQASPPDSSEDEAELQMRREQLLRQLQQDQ